MCLSGQRGRGRCISKRCLGVVSKNPALLFTLVCGALPAPQKFSPFCRRCWGNTLRVPAPQRQRAVWRHSARDEGEHSQQHLPLMYAVWGLHHGACTARIAAAITWNATRRHCALTGARLLSSVQTKRCNWEKWHLGEIASVSAGTTPVFPFLKDWMSVYGDDAEVILTLNRGWSSIRCFCRTWATILLKHCLGLLDVDFLSTMSGE